MWSKGADGGQACTHACPRAGPGARQRIVHMSTAWLFMEGGGGQGVVVVAVVGSPSWVGQCKVSGSVPNRSAALRVKRARL